MKAISYIRFSSTRQKLGDSLRRQLEKTRAYCEKNGLHLDESVLPPDLGVSAFRGRNVKEGALAGFLAAAEAGKIQRPCALIVESLDRLSREQISDALSLFTRILGTGIDIITLTPERHHTRATINDIAGIIEPLIVMSRAYEESAMKSERGTQAWGAKRKRVRESGKVYRTQCPWWLRHDKETDSFVTIPERVALVEKIFEMRCKGHGIPAILKYLNAGTLKPDRSDKWTPATVGFILSCRAVLGELQMNSRIAGKTVPDGDPLPNYYPAIIPVDVFHAAKRSRPPRGRANNGHVNIFKGLLFNSLDNHPMHCLSHTQPYKDKAYTYQFLVSAGAMAHVPGSNNDRLNYHTYEAGFLRCMQTLDPTMFATEDDSATAQEITRLTGEIAEMETRLVELKEQIKTRKFIKTLAEAASDTEEALAAAIEQRDKLKTSLTSYRIETLGELNTLTKLLAQAPTPQEANEIRVQIRGKLGTLVAGILVRIEPKGHGKNNKRLYTCGSFVAFADQKHWQMFIFDQDGNPTTTEVNVKSDVLLQRGIASMGERLIAIK